MGMDRIPRDKINKAKKLVETFFADESSSGKPPSVEDLRKGAHIALAAGTLGVALPGSAEGKDVRISFPLERQDTQTATLAEKDIAVLAKNILHEARGESQRGQLAVAQVTLARLLSGKFGKSVHDVVFAKNQFSWTAKENPLSKKEAETLEDIHTTLAFYLEGKPIKDAVQQLARDTGLPEHALFYKRADWDEYDPNEKRMSEGTKHMFRSLVRLMKIDAHMFYAEPRREAKKGKPGGTRS